MWMVVLNFIVIVLWIWKVIIRMVSLIVDFVVVIVKINKVNNWFIILFK